MGTFIFLEGWAAKSSLPSREGKALTTAFSRKLSSRPTDNYQHLSANRDLALWYLKTFLKSHVCGQINATFLQPLPRPLTKFTLGHVLPDGLLWVLFSEGFIAWIVLQIFIEHSLHARYCVLGNIISKTKSLPSNHFSSSTKEQVMSKRPSWMPRFGAKCLVWKGIK